MNSGTSWLSPLIRIIFTKCHELWLLRNKDRHGEDLESKQATQLEVAKRRVAYQYSKKALCHPTSQHLWFHTTAEEHFRLTPDLQALLSWLSIYPRLIRKQLQDKADLDGTGQQTLERYFNTTIGTRTTAQTPHNENLPRAGIG
jgi:hypothetical protein